MNEMRLSKHAMRNNLIVYDDSSIKLSIRLMSLLKTVAFRNSGSRLKCIYVDMLDFENLLDEKFPIREKDPELFLNVEIIKCIPSSVDKVVHSYLESGCILPFDRNRLIIGYSENNAFFGAYGD